MNINIKYLNNYMLSISESAPVFINKELYEHLTAKSFIDSFSDNPTRFYSFGLNPKGDELFIVPIKKLEDNSIIVNDDYELELGVKNDIYKSFEIAVDDNTPIIYDWVIGTSSENKKNIKKSDSILEKELIISCLCLIDGEFKYVQDKIIGQEPLKSKLQLEKLGSAFMVWGSYNTYQRLLLEHSGHDYNIADKLHRAIMRGYPIDLEKYADFISSKVDITSDFFMLPKGRIAPHLRPLFNKEKQLVK